MCYREIYNLVNNLRDSLINNLKDNLINNLIGGLIDSLINDLIEANSAVCKVLIKAEVLKRVEELIEGRF